MDKKVKTPKEILLKEFPQLTEIQLTKLTEAYFALNWFNPSINLEGFIIILSNDYNTINI